MPLPVGLALHSRAAPWQIGGLMIGVFYVIFFIANLSVSRIGGRLESKGGTTF